MVSLVLARTATYDAAIFDIMLPKMDGLEVLRRLRDTRPNLPVIVVSHVAETGAETTLNALNLGARDYVTKPNSTSISPQTLQQMP